jgi:glycosyltransferase involved in cell wall biosynthesis
VRLLVCSPRFSPDIGGAETWLREVALALARRGHDVRVIARATPGCPREHRVGELEVERAAGGRIAFSRAIAARVAARPDAVIAQYSALAPATLAARRRRVPCVGVVHDVYGVRESVRIKGWTGGLARTFGLEQWLRLSPPGAFAVPSEATATRLAALTSRPVTVVRAGADHVPVVDDGWPREDKLVFVGRLVHQKGVEDIIEALRLLHRRGRSATVEIIGAGPHEDALQAEARELNGSIRFAGALRDDALHAQLGRARALLLPSSREGWGIAVTEAASHGTPYVAYDIPAVREQHRRLDGGLLVPPEPCALAEAIDRVVTDPALAQTLGERGRRAAGEMTWDRAGAAMESALGALVGDRDGGLS